MAKILVVDDEEDLEILIKQKFRKKIREKKYEFLFAMNGIEALDKISQHKDIDVVLSDINMPEMDGLTLLTELHNIRTLMKPVIVSAYGDMDNIRTAMNRGAYDFITKPINFQDLETTMEKTIAHVQEMRESMQALKENNILKMYVDETVLNFMDSQEFEAALRKNETIDATVVFIDICGFTEFSENESPDTVIKLLNQLFDVMVKEIIHQKGLVDKFIGDAVMAVFKGEFSLDRAVEASIAVRDKIAKIPISEEINFMPQVSIGVNYGEMITGNIGSTELRRLDFTVIGDTVNTAQRLESFGGPNQILLPRSAYKLIKESFKCKKVGEIALKNKAEPIHVYEVME